MFSGKCNVLLSIITITIIIIIIPVYLPYSNLYIYIYKIPWLGYGFFDINESI